MNNPFEYTPSEEIRNRYAELLNKIEKLKLSDRDEDINLCRELENGKMLGVLIAEDGAGGKHTLYAFSGQLGDAGFRHTDFVEPVFDYLQPSGYFKTKEADISRQNREIERYENDILSERFKEYQKAKIHIDSVIAEYKKRSRLSKLARNAKRSAGNCDEDQLAEMTRQSQFEKAELRRLKKRLNTELQPISEKLDLAKSHLESLKEKRRCDSENLQQWLFSQFLLLNARGEKSSLKDIFAATAQGVAPSGAGECCAPKLLHSAFKRGWKPIEIAEFWYGKSKDGEIRIHGEHYPACRGKCRPILSWMLQGIELDPPLEKENHRKVEDQPEIIYENRWMCVVNKPAGMLSVPGKVTGISLEKWLRDKYGEEREVKPVHRLDQDTSGLVIAAFGQYSYGILQRLFASRQVRKTYIAILNGDYRQKGYPQQGSIDLPIGPDWLDRPRQRVDFKAGKSALTEYEFIDTDGNKSRIKFHPVTGRTHQLRVHAASCEGLGMPIAGDRLYGIDGGKDSPRLMLHAQKIEFVSPFDNQLYSFELPEAF